MNQRRRTLAILAAAVLSGGSLASAATLHAKNVNNDIGREISFSQPGDTVDFDGVVATIPQYTLKSHRTYVGSGAKLTAFAGKYVFQTDRADSGSFVLSGVDFTGPAIRCEAAAGWSHDIEVSNCNFHGNLYNGFPEHNGIFFSNGAKNCNIHNNFSDAVCDGMVIGYGYDGLLITDNDFANGGEGIHYFGHFGHSKQLTVSRNRFKNMRRMPIEIQGDGDYVVCEDNIVDGANILPDFNQNMDTFGISLACDGAQKVDCHRNKITSYERADGTGMRIAIELASDPNANGAIDCSDNYIDGTNSAIAVQTSLGAHVYNNHIQGSLYGTPNGGVQLDQEKNAVVTNNGASVALDWNINRAWPLNGVTPVSPTPTPTPTPAPTPTPTPTPAPTPTPTAPQATKPIAPNPTPATAPTDSGFTYLSNLTWASSSNYWGPVQKDESNGEQGANDGHTITIDGKTYKKGLGLHAGPNTQVTYHLAGKATTFKTDVGIDDEVYAENGQAHVQIWGDGKLLLDSGTIQSRQNAKSLSVDVTGVQDLTVKVLGVGNSLDGAHVDLGYARIYGDLTGVDTSATTTNNGGGASKNGPVTAGVFVNRVGFTTNKNGASSVGVDTDNTGNSLDVNNTTYSHGLGTQGDSKLTVNLGQKYSKFIASVGVDKNSGKSATADFQVWADGKKMYDSGTLNKDSRAHKVRVNVAGKKQMWLVVTDTSGHTKTMTLSDWLGAKLTTAAA